MQTADLSVHLAVKDVGVVAVVTIKDAFLNYASSEGLLNGLKDVCKEKCASGSKGFAVDLSCVTVMDSCGLSMIIAMKKAAEAGGAKLSLFGLTPMVRRLFSVTKLEGVFRIRDDERAACAAVLAEPAK
jgi:anti-sigma B factor antagonist